MNAICFEKKLLSNPPKGVDYRHSRKRQLKPVTNREETSVCQGG